MSKKTRDTLLKTLEVVIEVCGVILLFLPIVRRKVRNRRKR